MRRDLAPRELTPLEIASGLVFGMAPSEPPAESLEVPEAPLEALERAILPALRRPPCLMSFSGGRGSAVILAVGVQLARREGLEMPVPATLRVNGAAGAEDVAAQERVVIRLGLTEWIRLQFDDELDYVGPVASCAIRRHGLLWPSDAHAWIPLIEWAFGGSLITGLGYRKAFGLPPALVDRDLRPLPWLRPSARREVRARWTADAVARRRAQRHDGGWWLKLRQVEIGLDLLRRLAAERRVEVHHPLMDRGFAAALAAPRAQSVSVDVLVENLLLGTLRAQSATPPSTLACWSRFSRELVEEWRGEDIDPELVDLEALEVEWSRPHPDPRTSLLLQSISLARERKTPEELVEAGGR